MSTFDNQGVLTVDTIENTLLTCNDYSYKFILAILNSTFVSWFAYRFVYGKAIRSMDFDGYYVNKILIPKIDFTNPTEKSQHDELAALAQKMLLRTYLAHIDAETLDTLNAEYPKLDDKIRNLPVPDLTIEEMLQALSRWD